MGVENRVVNTRTKVCCAHMLVSTILYCFVLLFNLDSNFEIMNIYGYYSVAIFAILLLSELRLKGLNILLLFYFGAFLRLALPTIQMAEEAMNGATFFYFRTYTNYIFQCAVAMNIYYMLFILGLTHFAKDKSLQINMSVLFSIKHINFFIVIIYLIGFGARLIPDFITFADTLRRFVSVFPTLALLVLAFYSAYSGKISSYRLFLTLTIVEVLYAIILGFFKGAIMIPLVIYMIYYYLRCRTIGKTLINTKTILYTGLSVAFLFFFVYPFMETKRMESQWDPATNITYGDYDSFDIAKRVLRGEVKHETESSSEATTSRQSALPVNSYFYMSALTDDYQTRILKSALQLPIPRWMGGGSKISDNQGYLANAWLEDGNFCVSEDGIHSAAYVGSFASAFFWGGWPAALLMCLFNAWVIVTLSRFCFKNSTNVFALLILLQLVTGAISCYEEIHDGGISRAISWGVMTILALMLKWITSISIINTKKNAKQTAI